MCITYAGLPLQPKAFPQWVESQKKKMKKKTTEKKAINATHSQIRIPHLPFSPHSE